MHDPCISMHFQNRDYLFPNDSVLWFGWSEVLCRFKRRWIPDWIFYVSVMWSYFVCVLSFMIFFIWPSPFVSCCKRCHLWSRHLWLFQNLSETISFWISFGNVAPLIFKIVDTLWRCLRDSFFWCWCSLHVTCVTVHLLLWRTPNSKHKHSPSFHSFSFLTVARYPFFLLSCLYISRVLLPRASSSNYALLSIYSCV